MNYSNVNVQSKERKRNTMVFSRGIGESSLPTSLHSSTRARVWLPLDPRKDQVLSMGRFFDTPSRWIAHNMTWVIHKLHEMITKLPTTKPSRWWQSPRVTSVNSHLIKASLMRKVDAHLLFLCTNEIFNLALSNLKRPTILEVSLQNHQVYPTSTQAPLQSQTMQPPNLLKQVNIVYFPKHYILLGKKFFMTL